MGVTVREALKLGGLKRSTVVAGESGLDRIIKCVDILEVPDPRGWLRPNELLVTTGYAMKDDPDAQVRLMGEMARVGTAALAMKSGRFMGCLPPSMCALANEMSIPLINVPNDVPFVDITHPVMTAILNVQSGRLEYSERVHQQLTKVALEADNLRAVAETLSALLDRKVIICDVDFTVLAQAGKEVASETPDFRAAGRRRATLCAPGKTDGSSEGQSGPNEPIELVSFHRGVRRTYLASPVLVRGRSYGWILVETQTCLDELDLIAIEHAVTVTALQMVKEEAVAEAERGLRRDLLEDLLTGVFRHRELVLSRAGFVGISFDAPQVVIKADLDDFADFILNRSGLDEEGAGEVKRGLYRIVNSRLLAANPGAVAIDRSDSVVALYPVARMAKDPGTWSAIRQELLRTTEAIQKTVAADLRGVSVSIGISSPARDPMDLARKYEEAREALRLGRKVRGRGAVTFWEELEVYQLLDRLGQDLDQFYRSVIGRLDLPEVKNRDELLRTLHVYLESQGNAVAAAERLHIHRNTLRYRLKRIQELIGRDLEDPHERFSIWLALKARPLVGGTREVKER